MEKKLTQNTPLRYLYVAVNWLKYQIHEQLEYGKTLAVILGCFGLIGHPLWYVYWHYLDPNRALVYENLPMRVISVLSLILLILIALDKTPKLFRRYRELWFVVILAYNLPFFEMFFLLKKSGGDPSYLTYLMTFVATLIIFSVFTTGFTIFILFTFLSIALAVGLYVVTTAHPVLPPHMFELTDVGIYALFFCAIFSYNNRRRQFKLIRHLKHNSNKVFHEIRMPLTRLTARLSTCGELIGSFAENDSQAREKLSGLIADSQRDVGGIDTIINIFSRNMTDSRLKIREKDKKLIYASDIVAQAVRHFPFKYIHQKKLIAVNDAEDFEVYVSPELSVHVVMNIIGNALYEIEKYERGKITVALKQGENHNEIRITDTVGSLPTQYISLIFLSGFSRKSGNLGLGLSFCRDVMESVGGKIACEVKPSVWTAFKLYFPKV